MNENPQTRGTKHMKLNFYIPNSAPKYVGGRREIDFRFVDRASEEKRMRKKQYKKRYEYKIKRPLLETLNAYIEATKCRTLEKFMKEVKP